MRRISLGQVPYFLLIGIMLCLMIATAVSMMSFSETSDQERAASLVSAIRKAAVQCYSIEGSYPPNVEWLEAHYGLIIDHDQYVVTYDAFASNLMPGIEVQTR